MISPLYKRKIVYCNHYKKHSERLYFQELTIDEFVIVMDKLVYSKKKGHFSAQIPLRNIMYIVK